MSAMKMMSVNMAVLGAILMTATGCADTTPHTEVMSTSVKSAETSTPWGSDNTTVTIGVADLNG